MGVLSDYISFIWAEFIVSTSAIALAWTWITPVEARHANELVSVVTLDVWPL